MLNSFLQKYFAGRNLNGLRTNLARIPNGPRADPERILNEPRTALERIPDAPRTDSARTPNGFRTDSTDPERGPFERTPNEPRTYPELDKLHDG